MPTQQLINTIRTGTLYREFQIRQDAVDGEKRTIDLTFSSEEPYDRFWGVEILDHNVKSVIMDRLKDSGPVLVDHDRRDHVGVIERAWIGNDRRGHANIRLGKSSRAEEIFQDITDGIRVHVSVGYRIHKMILEETDGDRDTMRATKWEPFEISLVSIPADNTVGVGRAWQNNNNTHKIEVYKEVNMPNTTENDQAVSGENAAVSAPATRAADPPPAVDPPVDLDAVRRDAAEREMKRIQDIYALAARFNMRQQADDAIKDGLSVDQFRGVILDSLPEDNVAPITIEDPAVGLSPRDQRNYSLFRALRALAFRKTSQERVFEEAAAFEFEVSRAAAEKLSVNPQGMLIPYDIYMSRDVGWYRGNLPPGNLQRTLTAGTATDGAELVADNLLAGSFIDVLRNLTVVMMAGARALTGLVGDISIPRKTSGSSAGWVATEGGNVSQSEPQFDQVQMVPKTLGAYAEITRDLLLQSSLDIENLVRDDLAMAVAIAIDLAALYGSGASGQPTGVSNQTGINTPTNFAAAVPTWAEVVAMESAVAVDNALTGNLAYIIEPSMRGSLKTTEKASSTAKFIWDDNNMVNGYPPYVTNQITSGDVFFGNWRDLLIAFWGGLDVLIDPYTNSLAGTLRIVVHESVDIGVRHPVSFAYNNDGI